MRSESAWREKALQLIDELTQRVQTLEAERDALHAKLVALFAVLDE